MPKPLKQNAKPIARDVSTMTRDDWEQDIFDSATYFTVARKVGPGTFDRQEFTNFVDAINTAWHNRPQAMLYAANEAGRSFCIPFKQWKSYYEKWRAKHDQKV